MQRQLKPGIGVGDLRLGTPLGRSELDTEATRGTYARDGIGYSFDDAGVLSEIIITSSTYVTDRAIRVGSTTKEIRAAYGPGVEKQMTLSQGGTPIGKFGDVAIEYPGVVFIVSREHVAAIRLVADAR